MENCHTIVHCNSGHLFKDNRGVSKSRDDVVRYLAVRVDAAGGDFKLVDNGSNAVDGLSGLLGLDLVHAGLYPATKVDNPFADLETDPARVDVGLPENLPHDIAEDALIGRIFEPLKQ